MAHRIKGMHSQESIPASSTALQTTPEQAFADFMQGLTRFAHVPQQHKKPPTVVTSLSSAVPALPSAWHGLRTEYEQLHRAHTQFLFKHGVQLPRPGSQQLLSLIYLHRNMGALVSLESLRRFVHAHCPGGSMDKQPRHLKYKGWHIVLGGKSSDLLTEHVVYQDGRGTSQSRNVGERVPKGYLMLASDTTPSPDFIFGKRSGGIDRSSWQALCASYGNRCAVCGKPGVLEKGHKDPTKGPTPDNLLPMCSQCNNHASGDLVFDDGGRIAALASERFVHSASLSTRLRIFDALRKDRSVNINRI